MSGKVLNRAGLSLPRKHYDILIVGGGLLGLCCAYYLRTLNPERSLLVAEQGGVPSESGATHVAPAPAHSFFTGDLRRRAHWALHLLANLAEETGVQRPADIPFRRAGWARLLAEKAEHTVPSSAWLQTLDPDAASAVGEMLELSAAPYVLYDASAGYGSAEAAALHFGYGAVARGADLLLNARLQPLSEREFRVERLEYNRQMQREVTAREMLSADTVIIAAGAATPALVEEGTGKLTPYKRAYRQYPRVEADARLPLSGGQVALPVIERAGFVLRPQGEGLLVVPPPLPPDPEGYAPTGGSLLGVRVGLRREVLEALMSAADALPVLAWAGLNPGKTVHKVRGAWDTVTPSGYPEWRSFGAWHVLVGGEHGFTLGLACAYDLAARLGKKSGRPWDE